MPALAVGDPRMTEPDLPASPEASVWLELNGEPFVTWLCTPARLEELACGWLLGEGLIGDRRDVVELNAREEERCVRARIVGDVEPERRGGRRTVTRMLESGPGVAAFTLERIPRGEARPLPEPSAVIRDGHLRDWFQEMYRRCTIRTEGGGIHSGALVNGDSVLHVMEDVGRHNVVDKVCGAALLAGTPLEGSLVLLSGRISAEIAVKAWRARLGGIATLSIPTSLARSIAGRAGITLVGRSLTGSPFVYEPGAGEP